MKPNNIQRIRAITSFNMFECSLLFNGSFGISGTIGASKTETHRLKRNRKAKTIFTKRNEAIRRTAKKFDYPAHIL